MPPFQNLHAEVLCCLFCNVNKTKVPFSMEGVPKELQEMKEMIQSIHIERHMFHVWNISILDIIQEGY